MSTTYVSAALRREVTARAGGCCEYCRISGTDQFFAIEIDHVIAEKHGGTTTSDNLCLSCPDCNAYKGSDIASVDWENEGDVVPLFHPRRQLWHEHFSINYTTGHLEVLSAHARVTITLLRLNDADRVKDRSLLIEAQRYPCSR